MDGLLSRRDVLKLASAAGPTLLLGMAGCDGFARISPSVGPQPKSSVIPRPVPEGAVPLLAVEGTAYECGYDYGRIVLAKCPGYGRYLELASAWRSLPTDVREIFERRAPYVLDVYRGLIAAIGSATSAPSRAPSAPAHRSCGCTSFGVAGSITLDGHPISGQTKDTVVASATLYIVLRMRIKDGPTILALAYPGEVLGYGLWSTGMSLFRNSIYCRGGDGKGLSMEQWGLLALAGKSVGEAVELAGRFGISTVANCLVSDAAGRSVNVESNAGGVSIVPARDGIVTHANHPVGKVTALYEDYANPREKSNSRYRMDHLWELLNAERGHLTAQKAMMCLADHSRYPCGLCRHVIEGEPYSSTTAAVVAEPTRGRLHVVRGNPCANWSTEYTV